jgi:hypothetical protein
VVNGSKVALLSSLAFLDFPPSTSTPSLATLEVYTSLCDAVGIISGCSMMKDQGNRMIVYLAEVRNSKVLWGLLEIEMIEYG